MVEIYCPKCGEFSKSGISIVTLVPGNEFRVTCRGCKTKYRITTEFFEIESGEPEENEGEKVQA